MKTREIDHNDFSHAQKVPARIDAFADELVELTKKHNITGHLCFVKHSDKKGALISTLGEHITSEDIAACAADCQRVLRELYSD